MATVVGAVVSRRVVAGVGVSYSSPAQAHGSGFCQPGPLALDLRIRRLACSCSSAAAPSLAQPVLPRALRDPTGRGGRGPNQKPKSAEQLDRELEEYLKKDPQVCCQSPVGGRWWR